MGRIFLLAASIFIAACGSGPDGGAACAANCGSATATIAVEAGPKIIVFEGEHATLAGSAIHPDNLGMQFAWTQVAGPVVPIKDADQLTATFVAPFLGIADFTESMVFRLTATANDGSFGFDVVEVVVERGVAIAPDVTVTSLSVHGEVGENDSVDTAEAVFFPVLVSAKTRGVSIVGNIGRSRPVRSGQRDSSDVFVFSPVVAGTYEITLCAGTSVCRQAAGNQDWQLILLDHDSKEIAFSPGGSLAHHAFAANLDAGLPYYVAVKTIRPVPVPEQYRLSIIPAGNPGDPAFPSRLQGR